MAISEITQVPSNVQVIKILNELIKRYNSLGSIYTFKGSVQTYAELLAIENPNVGDVYNVVQEDEEHQIAAGSNFVWDGTVWDNLGGSLAGLVQSVNGINPDSLGNVLLPLIKNITTNQGVMTFTKNDDTTVNVNNVKKLYTSALGENVDLNVLTEAGIYLCGNDSYAANYENCPIQKAFLLEVQALNDETSNFVYQFLTQYNDGSTEAGNQYTRTYYNGNWSAWRMAGSSFNPLDAYPVGSIYMSTNSTNPGTLFGGTWEAFGQGRVLIGAGEGTDANSVKKTFTGGATGGEYEHKITTAEMPSHNHTASTNSTGSHTHTGTAARAGAHTHTIGCTTLADRNNSGQPPLYEPNNTRVSTSSNGAHTHSVTIQSAGAHQHTVTVNNTGSSAAHNNLPPYVGVYFWRRTA